MGSFLSPLLDRPTGSWILRNVRTGRAVATTIEPAFDSESRRRGLLGRDGIDAGAALIIAPCSSIHMFFMRFAIDVVFADRSGRVVKACRNVRPWRIAIARGAFAAVELPVGAIELSETRPGDQLEVSAGA